MRTASVVVTEDHGECGIVTWWALSGNADREQLEAQWDIAGLEPELLPPEVSPEVALRRAVDELRGRHQLVRRLPDKTGWALVSETAVANDLDYNVEVRARLDALGNLKVEPSGHSSEGLVTASFQRCLREVRTTDVSCWLVRLAAHVNAVQLRRGGGVYFVPRATLATWRSMIGAIERSSAHVMWRVPAMRTDEAVASVMAAIVAEAEAEAAAFEESLEQGLLGQRGLNNRVDQAEAMKLKVASYEDLLGVNLEALRDKLERLRAGLAAAALAAADIGAEEAA